jgi:hypothetical protein
MSDARWLDIEADLQPAISHFARSVQIFDRGGFSGDGLEAYIARAALMQAMQSAYTSLEGAFERILKLLGEERPSDPNYDAVLLRRLASDVPGSRPAIIGGDLFAAIDEVRRFRRVTYKSRDAFHIEGAARAVKAATFIRDHVGTAIEEFQRQIDPE